MTQEQLNNLIEKYKKEIIQLTDANFHTEASMLETIIIDLEQFKDLS